MIPTNYMAKIILNGHCHIGNSGSKGVVGNKRFMDIYIKACKEEKIMIVDDLDNPKNDEKAINSVKRFIKWFKPDKIIDLKKVN